MSAQSPKFTTHTVSLTPEEKAAIAHRIVAHLHEALDAFVQQEAQRLGHPNGQRLWPIEPTIVALGAVMVASARAGQCWDVASRTAQSVLLMAELDAAPAQPIGPMPPANTTRH